MKIKTIRKNAELLEITKEEQSEYDIKAVITTFGNKDKVGDVMLKGCLDKFLEKFDSGKTDVVRMLFNHNRDKILGKWVKFEIIGDKVIGYGKMSDVSMADDVKTLIKDGILKSVSIGFKAEKYEFRDEEDDKDYFMPMDFKQISLFETSVVDTPANEKAEILETKDDIETNVRFISKILKENGFTKDIRNLIISNAKKDYSELKKRNVERNSNNLILNAIKDMTIRGSNERRDNKGNP